MAKKCCYTSSVRRQEDDCFIPTRNRETPCPKCIQDYNHLIEKITNSGSENSSSQSNVEKMPNNIQSEQKPAVDAVNLRYNYIKEVFSKLGNYCRNHNDKRIRELPSLMEIICNVSDDPRSDWYVQTLCNMAFSTFILEVKSEEASMLKVFNVVTAVLLEIEKKCGFRLVLENFFNSEGKDLQYLEDIMEPDENSEYIEIIGFKDFVENFGKIYNAEEQKEEYRNLQRNVIILYVKIMELDLTEVNLDYYLGDREDLLYALHLFADRGLIALSNPTPNRFCPLITFSKGDEEFDGEENLSIFKSITDVLYACAKEKNNDVVTETIKTLKETIHRLYRMPEIIWKDKLYMNSALSYAIRQNRVIFQREPALDFSDMLCLMTMGLSLFINGSSEITEGSGKYDLIRMFDRAEEECRDKFISNYGMSNYLDLCDRSKISETQSILTWYGLFGEKYLEYIIGKNWSILPLVRTIDKKMGKLPKYKNRMSIYNSLDANGVKMVMKLEKKLENYSLYWRRNNRRIIKVRFDMLETEYGFDES